MHVSDKSLHFFAYFGLSFLLGTTLWLASTRFRRLLPLWVLVVGAAYGAFDEFTQQFFRRTPDVMDWLADCGGTAAGAGVLWVAQQMDRRRRVVEMAVE
jgi:VanZ family protein